MPKPCLCNGMNEYCNFCDGTGLIPDEVHLPSFKIDKPQSHTGSTSIKWSPFPFTQEIEPKISHKSYRRRIKSSRKSIKKQAQNSLNLAADGDRNAEIALKKLIDNHPFIKQEIVAQCQDLFYKKPSINTVDFSKFQLFLFRKFIEFSSANQLKNFLNKYQENSKLRIVKCPFCGEIWLISQFYNHLNNKHS